MLPQPIIPTFVTFIYCSLFFVVLSKVLPSFQTYFVLNQSCVVFQAMQDKLGYRLFCFIPLFNALKGQIIAAQGNALGLSTLYAFAQLLAMQHMFCQNKVLLFCQQLGNLTLYLLSCPYRAQQTLLLITLGVAQGQYNLPFQGVIIFSQNF